MKTFFLRLAVIVMLIVFQFSFLNVLFPGFETPILLIAATVAYTRLLVFSASLAMVVPLGVLYDMVASGGLTMLSFSLVVLAYGTSFVSRRLLVEHPKLGTGTYAFLVMASVFVFQAVVSVWEWYQWSESGATYFRHLVVSPGILGSSMLMAVLLYGAVSAGAIRLETGLRKSGMPIIHP